METLAVHALGTLLLGWQVARLSDPGGFLYEAPFTLLHAGLIGMLVAAYALGLGVRARIRYERQEARMEREDEMAQLEAERAELVAERRRLIEAVAEQTSWVGGALDVNGPFPALRVAGTVRAGR